MNTPSLSDFVSQARKTRRIRFGDLRRLRRDILLGRIATRQQAELLIDLDGVHTADPDWVGFLIGAVRDFVVWGEGPVGIVDRKKAEWLNAALSRGGVTKTGRMLAREIARDAWEVDESLLALAGVSIDRGRGAATIPGLGQDAAARPTSPFQRV